MKYQQIILESLGARIAMLETKLGRAKAHCKDKHKLEERCSRLTRENSALLQDREARLARTAAGLDL